VDRARVCCQGLHLQWLPVPAFLNETPSDESSSPGLTSLAMWMHAARAVLSSSRLQSQSARHGYAETIRRSGEMNRQDFIMATIMSVDGFGNEPDQSSTPSGFEAALLSRLASRDPHRGNRGGAESGGKLQSKVGQDAADRVWFRCASGQILSPCWPSCMRRTRSCNLDLAQDHGTNRIVCTRLDAARWATLSRRATGPQGERVAAGMAKVTHWHLLRELCPGAGGGSTVFPEWTSPGDPQ
jgi:hypothetical protein